MTIRDFLRLISAPGRTNFLVVCSDDLGLNLLLQSALAPIARPEDLHFFDAEGITKEKARQIEDEARLAPRSGSPLAHFFIYSLHRLSTDSVGPLLKAVEEARYSRFIFQAQSTPPKIHTLMSRSAVVRLPFLTKQVVLGNMKAMNHDARTADQLNLYDGTLSGTIRALSMKDSMLEFRRYAQMGMNGLTALFHVDVLNSLAFDPAMEQVLSQEEKAYTRRLQLSSDSELLHARKRIALYHALGRTG
jgi:hypothetical protein